MKAGTYGLFTIPGKTSWDVMLSKDLNLGANVGAYNKENEVVRVQVKPTTLANKRRNLHHQPGRHYAYLSRAGDHVG